MSGSVANLDIKVDVKSIKEALPLLEKLAAASAKVEKQIDSLNKTNVRVSKSGDSIDKQAERQAKALAALDRNLERGSRRFEELQRSINRAGIGDRLRYDMQNRINKAFTEYNKVIANSGSTQRQVATAVRHYDNAVKGLNESIKTHVGLEKQKTREMVKNATEQLRAAKEYLRGSQAVTHRSRATQNVIDSVLGTDLASQNRRDAELKKFRSQIESTIQRADGYVKRQRGTYKNLIDTAVEAGTRQSQAFAAFYNNQAAQAERAAAKLEAIEKRSQDRRSKQSADAQLREQKAAVQSALAYERAVQAAQSRASNIGLRADRQLNTTDAVRVRTEAANALRVYEQALIRSGVGTQQAIVASGQFQRTMQGLSSEIAKTNGLLPGLDRNARTISASFGAANASLGGFSRLIFATGAAMASLAGALGMREIIQASMNFDRFSNTLKTVSQTTVEYRRNLNYLFAEGDRIGFNISEVGNAFARMSVAMKGAGFNTQQTQEAFTNLTEASRNFGISSADTMGIIRALEQSLSKGKFMAEEVRLQMGDRLPIAMAALSAALTKVDGRVSDVSDRFERGTIDVQRYALEFTRQINLMSGGAAALERTSNTIAAAFGRLGNELQRNLMVFKEEGFDAAVINVTNSLTGLLASLRETGVLAAFANAIEFLSKNLEYLAIILVGLSTSWLARALVAFGAFALRMNKITLALSLTTAAITGLGTSVYSTAMRMEHLGKSFAENSTNIAKSLEKIKEKSDDVNSSIQRGFQQTTSSAKSDFENMQAQFEKLGFTASKAIEMALKAQAESARLEVTKIKSEVESAGKAIENAFNAIQGRLRTTLQAQTGGAYSGPLGDFSTQLLKIMDDAATAKQSVGDTVIQIEALRDAAISRHSDQLLVGQISLISEELVNRLKDPKNLAIFGPMLAQFNSLHAALAEATRLYNEMAAAANNAAQGQFNIPDAGEMYISDGVPTRPPHFKFDFSKFNPNEKNESGARTFLQQALRGVEQSGAEVGQTLILRDMQHAEAYLNQLREAAKGTGAAAEGARAILKRYDEELRKGEKTTGDRKRTLADYNMELTAHIAQNNKIIEAYKKGNAQGRLYEDTVEAIREVGKYIKPTYDAAGNATGKFAEAVKQTIDQKHRLAQTERDIKVFKDENLREIQNELDLMEKEKSLLGENIQLREEELEVFRKRQELTKEGPVSQDILDKAEKQVRILTQTRRELNHLNDSYEAVAGIAENAFDQVADSITDAFARGEISALKFGNIIRGVMSSVVSQFLRLGVINPILNNLLPTQSIRPTLMAGFGGSGSGVFGELSSLGGMLGLSGMLPAGGLSGMMAGANSFLFGQGAVGALGPQIPTAGLLGSGGSMSLGALGAGFGAGMFTNSLLGGNQTGGMIGSGLGSLAGMALGSLIGMPFLGAILGGAGGGGLGGMFGPKESVKGWSYAIKAANPDPSFGETFGDRLIMDDIFYNDSGREQFDQANAMIAQINEYISSRGLTLSGARAVGGNKNGPDSSWGGAASFADAFATFQFGSKDNEGLAAGLVGRSFDDPAKLQEYVEGFLEIQEVIRQLTTEALPEYTVSMQNINDSFANARERAVELGASIDGMAEAQARAVSELENARTETLRQISTSMEYRKLMAQGRNEEADLLRQQEDARLELQAFEMQLKSLALTAEDVANRLAYMEEVQAMERAAIIARYAEQANQELNRAIEKIIQAGGNIRQYLDGLISTDQGGMSITDQFANAQTIYNRDLELAKINDLDALGRITESANNLLEAGRGMFASSPEFHAIREGIIASLSDLPAVKSYDQRIAEGIELANTYLSGIDITSTDIYGAVSLNSVGLLLDVLTEIKTVLEASQGNQFTIGEVTNSLIFGVSEAVYSSLDVSNGLLFEAIATQLLIAEATNTILAGIQVDQISISSATNTILADMASNTVDIGNATNTLLGDFAAIFVSGAAANVEAIGATNKLIFDMGNYQLSAIGAQSKILVDSNKAILEAFKINNEHLAAILNATNSMVIANPLNSQANAILASVKATEAHALVTAGQIQVVANRAHSTVLHIATHQQYTLQGNATLGMIRDIAGAIQTIAVAASKANVDTLNSVNTNNVVLGNATNIHLGNINQSLATVHKSIIDVNSSLATVDARIFNAGNSVMLAQNAGNTIAADASNAVMQAFKVNNDHLAALLGATKAPTSHPLTTQVNAVLASVKATEAHALVTAGQIQVVANRAHSTVLHIATHQQYTLQGNATLGMIRDIAGAIQTIAVAASKANVDTLNSVNTNNVVLGNATNIHLGNINQSLATVHKSIIDVNSSLATVDARIFNAGNSVMLAQNAGNTIAADASNAVMQAFKVNNDHLAALLNTLKTVANHSLIIAGQIQSVANNTNSTVLHIATHQQYTLQGNAQVKRAADILTATNPILNSINTNVTEAVNAVGNYVASFDTNTTSALNTINTILVDGFAAQNTILVDGFGAQTTSLGLLNTNSTLNLNSINTNLVAGFGAMTQAIVALHGMADSHLFKLNEFSIRKLNEDINLQITATNDLTYAGNVNDLWIKENAYRTANNTARLVDVLNYTSTLPGSKPPGQIGVLPNAFGNAFNAGNIIPYRNGGLPEFANSPTFAPIALFGEAGPEAILPLARTSSGKLGVASVSDSESNDEFRQYRVQSAAETRELKEELARVREEIRELTSVMTRGARRD